MKKEKFTVFHKDGDLESIIHAHVRVDTKNLAYLHSHFSLFDRFAYKREYLAYMEY